MINEQIRDREVRVIGPNGEQLGIMSAKEAYFKAKDAGLDFNKLVELLGGKDNIINTETNMSRFKVTLKDVSKANKEGIQKLGAKGIVEIDNQLKIILGSNSKQLKKYIDQIK